MLDAYQILGKAQLNTFERCWAGLDRPAPPRGSGAGALSELGSAGSAGPSDERIHGSRCSGSQPSIFRVLVID
jgi:hypothetical protein